MEKSKKSTVATEEDIPQSVLRPKPAGFAESDQKMLSLDVQALLMALGPVGFCVPRKSPKPILHNVRLEVDPEEGSYLSATNLEVGIKLQLLGVKAEEPRVILLNPVRLGSILRQAKGEIYLSPAKDTVGISGDRFSFEFPTEDSVYYPVIPDDDLLHYHEITALDLLKGIARTKFATDTESTRYALGGVLFEAGEETLNIVGTDGRRMAQQAIPAEMKGEGAYGGKPFSSVIPLQCLLLLEKLIDKNDSPVRFGFVNQSSVIWKTHNATIYSRLVEGRFPRYREVFPSGDMTTLNFQSRDLREGMELASISTGEESRGIDCEFADGRLTMKGCAADVGKGEVDLIVFYTGKPINITFDPRYVIEMLAAVGDDVGVRLDLIDEKNAAVFKTDDSYKYVVMPLTRDR